MARLVQYPLRDGGTVVIEEAEPDTGPVTRGLHPKEALERATETATGTFEDALDHVRPLAQSMVAHLRNLADAPDEIHVEFGIALHGEIGTAFVTKAGADANFKVSLAWHRSGDGINE